MNDIEKAKLMRLLRQKIELNQQTTETLGQLVKALHGRRDEFKVRQLLNLISRQNNVLGTMNETMSKIIDLLNEG